MYMSFAGTDAGRKNHRLIYNVSEAKRSNALRRLIGKGFALIHVVSTELESGIGSSDKIPRTDKTVEIAACLGPSFPCAACLSFAPY